jgi:hypothetical protein
MNPANLPRADVGGSSLIGAVAVLLGLLQHDTLFEFDAVSGAVAVIVAAAASYLPAKHKNFLAGVATLIGAVVAFLVGKAVFGVEGDVAAFSYAVAGLLVAGVGYLAPARSADGAQPVVEVPAAQSARIRHPFT